MTSSTVDDNRQQLLVVSNRGPITFKQDDNGNLLPTRGGGGLVTALTGVTKTHDLTWVSHVMSEADEFCVGKDTKESDFTLRLVGKCDSTYERYYNQISNPLLWFLQHRLYGFGWTPTITRSTHKAWESYSLINKRIADAVVGQISGKDNYEPAIMVHDYHLFLAPKIIRDGLSNPAIDKNIPITFFLHIPWPDPGAWRALPKKWVASIIKSLLACDIIGFQTKVDADNFLRSCQSFLDIDVEHVSKTVNYNDREIKVKIYPISVSVDEFNKHAASKEVIRLKERISNMRPKAKDAKLIVRVDRTDPSKNIVRGFHAYRLLLEENPHLHEKVSMFCQLDPSRQDIAEYVDYLAQTRASADAINRRFSTDNWQPIHINIDTNFTAAVAAYMEYDILFVNPVADGMNLVSKEGPLVNEKDGVVVLSDQAGSFYELGEDVIEVNPFDVLQQARALLEAINLPRNIRKTRANNLKKTVIKNDINIWIDTQIDDISKL